MPKQRFGLGRGLDALIPGATLVPDDAPMDTGLSNSALFEVSTALISPNPRQPRMPLSDDPQLPELVKSIEEFGLLQPLLVRLDDEDEQGAHYQLIAGERRLRAAKIAGLATVPVVIREATPLLMLEMALVENLQRTDLNPLEEAQGYQMLIDDYHLTQEQVAELVGRDRTTVTNTLRLLQLPSEVREFIVTLPKVFTAGHARAVLQVPGETERIELTRRIIAQLMSVRQAEEEARRYNDLSLKRMTSDKRDGRQRPQSYDTQQLERVFMNAIEMQVRLQRSTRGKGKLTITFTNDDQFQRLYELLIGPGSEGSLDALTGNGSEHAYAALLGNGNVYVVEETDGGDN